ncbi:MAG TPA: ribulose-phosphate 3-epimerase [Candidatus Limnocylindrales bacterium]|nr:ribulose-phosphate 3-epimerase [Candidatus Limnocylindrales bacterium]
MAPGRARVAASILDADQSNLGLAVRRAAKEGADRIHLDVMDGHFVPNLTWGAKMIAALRRHAEIPFDAHLMISNPAQYVDEFIEAGCDSITFHVEVSDDQVEPTLRRIREAGRAAGLALRPKTPLSALEPYRSLIDIVLVMTVEPGFGGQSFMKDVALEKCLAAREYLHDHPVSAEVHVDGGVNRQSAELLGEQAVDILVVGSALFRKGADMGREIRLIRALADEGYQYGRNGGVPPTSRDAWAHLVALPAHLGRRLMAEVEAAGIPVLMLRGNGRINPDGVRDYDLLVPAPVAALAEERHAVARERYLAEAEEWRASFDRDRAVEPA